MDQKLNKSRLMVILIFAMSIIPFMVAWLLKGDPVFIKGRVNNGQLIEPVITTGSGDLSGIDQFSAENLKELNGHWVMLTIVPGSDCPQICVDAAHKTKQLLLMMNKDLTRIRRATLFFKAVSPDYVQSLFKDDKVLLKVTPSAALAQKILALGNGVIEDGMLILMDPLGNLMMQYPPGFDPYKVKNDLTHLLKISQIG